MVLFWKALQPDCGGDLALNPSSVPHWLGDAEPLAQVYGHFLVQSQGVALPALDS